MNPRLIKPYIVIKEHLGLFGKRFAPSLMLFLSLKFWLQFAILNSIIFSIGIVEYQTILFVGHIG